MSFLSSVRDYFSDRVSDLQERTADLRDRVLDYIDRLADLYSNWRETEAGEAEFFDEEHLEEEEPPIEADLEQAEADLEHAEADLEHAEADLEHAEADLEQETTFPDWMTEEQINLAQEAGIINYDEFTENEKDFLIPGWRGFELADEPARDLNQDEMQKFRDEMAEELNLSPEQIKDMSDDDLLTLAIIGDTHDIGLAREFSDLEPEDIAEDLELNFRGSFIDMEALLNSKLYEFIMERPDIFDIDIHNDGTVDVYEDEES